MEIDHWAAGMTEKAKRFIAANANSPVVSGSAKPEGGARYRLRDGKVFVLTLAECRSMPMPKWDHFTDGAGI